MSYDDDQIALAAEYVLGTLDEDERKQAESLIASDRGFQQLVAEWEGKLGELHAMVASLEPPAHLFEKIRASLNLPELNRPFVLPETSASTGVSPVAADDVAKEAVAELAKLKAANDKTASRPEADNVVALSSQLRRWRGIGQLTTALAAGLAAFIAVQAVRPDLLPQGLRAPAKVERVEVQVPGPIRNAQTQLVGVLQRDTSRPAFLISVDPDTKSFIVRKVSAPIEPGKSYELWIISDRLNAPRSLGVVGVDDFTTGGQQLAPFDADMIRSGTYAVTVEQEGGSPNGNPTSAPIFTGRLVPAVPQQRL
jgi:anti-sigma-K factor RskA